MPTIRFTIPGKPVSKPRQTRRDKWLNPPRKCVAEWRDWADAARQAAGQMPAAEQVTELCCVFYFTPPKSWSGSRKAAAVRQCSRHRARPDADNCGKAVMDALFVEDSALADVSFRKRYSVTPRVEVTIEFDGGDCGLPAASAASDG